VTITASMLVRGEADSVDGGRIDFEDGMTYAPVATLALLSAMISVFAWEVSVAALRSREAIIAAGALVRERVLEGEFWRAGTATFLHGSPDHLIGNCVSLYILGMACEHAVGWRRLLMIFAAGALGGWGLSLLHQDGPSVGASGAIFGIMGAVIVILYRERDVFVIRDKRIGVVIAVWAAYTLAIGALQPMIDNWAHLGGLAIGSVAALAAPLRRHFRQLQRMRVGARRIR
jgi:rhomboid protease GluP